VSFSLPEGGAWQGGRGYGRDEGFRSGRTLSPTLIPKG
jgi:hypothetical protein